MFTKAESYVPAIVYANAGGAIHKHAAVVLAGDGLVYLSTGVGDERFLGIAMEVAAAGEHVLVQTDGIRYGWEGTPSLLTPGATYYTSLAGTLKDTGGVRVGLATDASTLVFSGGSTAPSAPPSSGSSETPHFVAVYEFIKLVASPLTVEGRIAATWIPLKTPVKTPTDILEIRLIGGGTLLPGIDYIITTTPPVPGAGVSPPSTAIPVGGLSSVTYTAINFDPALLSFTAPEGEESLLPRLRIGSRLLVVRKDV